MEFLLSKYTTRPSDVCLASVACNVLESCVVVVVIVVGPVDVNGAGGCGGCGDGCMLGIRDALGIFKRKSAFCRLNDGVGISLFRVFLII